MQQELQARRVLALKRGPHGWEVMAAVGMESGRLEDSSVSFTVIDEVARTGTAQLVADVKEQQELDGSMSLLMGGVQSFACAPWWAPGPELAGVLYADTSIRGGFFASRQLAAAQRAIRNLESELFGTANDAATAEPPKIETRRVQVAPATTPKAPVPMTAMVLPERAVWLRSLAAMIDSGLPAARGLEVLAQTTPNPQHRSALHHMLRSLESGIPLFQALSDPRGYFSKTQLQLIRASEVSGSLDLVLKRLADHEDKFTAHRQRLASALLYPACVLALSLVMLMTLTPWVLRGQLQLLAQSAQPLPWATRLLVVWGDHPLLFLLALAGLGLAGFSGLRRWLQRPDAAAALLHWPVLGHLLRCSASWRFCQTYSLLLDAGISLPEALRYAAGASMHPPLIERIEQILDHILDGWQVSEAIKAHAELSPMVGETLQVGEETGKTAQILRHLGDLVEFEFDSALESWSAMLEPLLVAGTGIFVAVVLLATMAPTISLLQNL